MDTYQIDPQQTQAQRQEWLDEVHEQEKREAEQQRAKQQAGINGQAGGGQITIRGDEVEYRPIQVDSYSAADFRGNAADQGLMSTLQRPGGGPVIGETRGSDLIEIQGQKVSLDVAVTLGYVRQVGPGQWQEVTPGK